VRHSSERILTTHVGSLPRPPEMMAILAAREALDGGRPPDPGWPAAIAAAVAETVRDQVDMGIDVVNDGEVGKPSFLHYVNHRLPVEHRGLAGKSPLRERRGVPIRDR